MLPSCSGQFSHGGPPGLGARRTPSSPRVCAPAEPSAGALCPGPTRRERRSALSHCDLDKGVLQRAGRLWPVSSERFRACRGWKTSEEEDPTTCENWMKFQFQCSQITFSLKRATLTHSHVVCGCFSSCSRGAVSFLTATDPQNLKY